MTSDSASNVAAIPWPGEDCGLRAFAFVIILKKDPGFLCIGRQYSTREFAEHLNTQCCTCRTSKSYRLA